MKGCILSEIGDNPKLFDRLMELTNNDNLKSVEYLATITSPEFADWYKANVGSELDITNMSKVSPTLLQLSRKFTNVDNFSVDNTIQRYDSSRTGVFGNDLLKEDHAVNILANLFLKGENFLIRNNKGISPKFQKQVLVQQLILHKKNNKDSNTSD